MVNERIVKAVFNETRRFYEQGPKSSNKQYDVDASPWYKRWFGGAESQNVKQEAANINIGAISRPGARGVGLATASRAGILNRSDR
jgi:hypothetical protein